MGQKWGVGTPGGTPRPPPAPPRDPRSTPSSQPSAPGRAAGGNPGRVPIPTEGGWPRCPRQGCTQCRGPQAPHRRCTPAGSKRSRCAAPRSPWPPGLRLLLGDIDQIHIHSCYPSSHNTHYPAIPSHYLCPNQLLSAIHSCYPPSIPAIIQLSPIPIHHQQMLSTTGYHWIWGPDIPSTSYYQPLSSYYVSIYIYICHNIHISIHISHIHTSIYTIISYPTPSAHPGSGVGHLDPPSTAAIHGVYMC
jgi:hypothetical protein